MTNEEQLEQLHLRSMRIASASREMVEGVTMATVKFSQLVNGDSELPAGYAKSATTHISQIQRACATYERFIDEEILIAMGTPSDSTTKR